MHVPRATRDFRPAHLLGKGFPLNKLTARGSALPQKKTFSRFHRVVKERRHDRQKLRFYRFYLGERLSWRQIRLADPRA